ncbi:hypothetical protein JOC94_004576 [Bacillus thermophilus]|uniref:Uncharacterized protein n=1 Tax=Siminovitchia thermophila TaxID=1245522 RepID=A0ABS2RD14_9BACI|nr:hypothetical protein [Siminovitchia thermophila]
MKFHFICSKATIFEKRAIKHILGTLMEPFTVEDVTLLIRCHFEKTANK